MTQFCRFPDLFLPVFFSIPASLFYRFNFIILFCFKSSYLFKTFEQNLNTFFTYFHPLLASRSSYRHSYFPLPGLIQLSYVILFALSPLPGGLILLPYDSTPVLFRNYHFSKKKKKRTFPAASECVHHLRHKSTLFPESIPSQLSFRNLIPPHSSADVFVTESHFLTLILLSHFNLIFL